MYTQAAQKKSLIKQYSLRRNMSDEFPIGKKKIPTKQLKYQAIRISTIKKKKENT